MNEELPFWQQVLVGLITLILLSSVAIVGIKFSTGSFSKVYVLHAVFDHTGHGLDDASTVKMRGVNIGRVSTIKLLRDDRADVSIRVQQGVRIPTDAAVSAEPLSVFGPLYIKVDPGPNEGQGPFLRPGGRINQTTSPTEITDILNRVSPLLTAIDPQDLVTVFHTIAEGFDGLGPAMGRTIDNGTKLVDLLDRQSPNARQFLSDLATLANAMGDKAPTMVSMAQDLNAVLPVVASRRDQIGQMLDAASRLSGDFADLTNQHSPATDQMIAGALTVVGPVYQQLAFIPSFLAALNNNLNALGKSFRIPGSNGHLISTMEGQQPVTACLVLNVPGC